MGIRRRNILCIIFLLNLLGCSYTYKSLTRIYTLTEKRSASRLHLHRDGTFDFSWERYDHGGSNSGVYHVHKKTLTLNTLQFSKSKFDIWTSGADLRDSVILHVIDEKRQPIQQARCISLSDNEEVERKETSVSGYCSIGKSGIQELQISYVGHSPVNINTNEFPADSITIFMKPGNSMLDDFKERKFEIDENQLIDQLRKEMGFRHYHFSKIAE